MEAEERVEVTDAMPNGKLEPCPNPWCGHIPTDMPVFWKREGWRVYCDLCNLSGPRCPSAEGAITAWNTRATAAAEARRAALSEASATVRNLAQCDADCGFPDTAARLREAADAIAALTPPADEVRNV